VTDVGRKKQRYTDGDRQVALEILAANGGNVAKTSRETGIRYETLRKWRDRAAAASAVSAAGATDASASDANTAAKDSAPAGVTGSDLVKFSKDSWDIIHKANEVVRDGISEMGAKDAASIAAGYFDRQAKADERLSKDDSAQEEYVVQWDGKK